VRVVIADDAALFREGTAGDGDTVRQVLSHTDPDEVVLDGSFDDVRHGLARQLGDAPLGGGVMDAEDRQAIQL